MKTRGNRVNASTSRRARGPVAAAATAGAVLALAAAASLASPSPTAHVTATSVSLNLQGGYANHAVTACAIRHHYTYFHPRRRISYKGSVSPAPGGAWTVKVKVKKCARGQFRTVFSTHAPGKSGGRFDGSFRSPGRGYFFARAYYYGVTPAAKSDKQYFRVR
jgi:hypothetical protein